MTTIVEHAGPRAALAELFALADDSAAAIAAYRELGTVLVARVDEELVGHAQLVASPEPGVLELKSLAVLPAHRGRGLGRRLVTACLDRARAEGARRLEVATAAADVDNLGFYQRLGFRLLRVERDAFTADAGYPVGLEANGIPVRDRVWLDRAL